MELTPATRHHPDAAPIDPAPPLQRGRAACAARQQGTPSTTASLRRAGLHRLSFRPISMTSVAEKLGYRQIAEAMLSPEERQGRGGEALFERLTEKYEDGHYILYDDRLELRLGYPIGLFYFIEVPYYSLMRQYPKTGKLLISFLALSQKIGMAVWDEYYYTDSAIESLDEQANEFDPDEADYIEQWVADARALSEAIGKCRIKRVNTLKRHLQAARGTSPSEQLVINTMLRWVDLLAQPDRLVNYDGDYREDDGYGDAIPPSARFIISPLITERFSEMIDYSVQEAQVPELVATFTLRSYQDPIAMSLFPTQVCQMIVTLNEAIEQLIPSQHD